MNISDPVSPISSAASKKTQKSSDATQDLSKFSLLDDTSDIKQSDSLINAFNEIPPVSLSSLYSVQEYASLDDDIDEELTNSKNKKQNQTNSDLTEENDDGGEILQQSHSENLEVDSVGGANQGGSPPAQASNSVSSGESEELTDDEEQQVDDLQKTDREVRQHEQAHTMAGGGYAGAPSYTMEEGPDGNQYAVEGEVKIDTSPVNDNPEATIQKMEIVKKAALAPMEPSAADKQVAMTAEKVKTEAKQELKKQDAEEKTDEKENDGVTSLADGYSQSISTQKIGVSAYSKIIPLVPQNTKNISYLYQSNDVNLTA